MKTSFPKNKINVVLFENIHPRAKERFEEHGFNVELLPKALKGDELKAKVANAHLLGIRSKTQMTREIFEAAPHLLALGNFCIGTNQVDLPFARSLGRPVFNSPFSNTRSVAELTIAEIVVMHRSLFKRSAELHRGTWNKSAVGAHEIRGRTLGIVGYGHIGTQVSVLAEAMGMKVYFYDIIPKMAMGNAIPTGSFAELLSKSDVVTLHVPATPVTKNLMGEKEIAMMKPGSYLINNARGSVVEIPALAAALKSGHLAGAAVDVYPKEPASAAETFESELKGIDTVVLSPHIGGSTEEAQKNIADDVATKLLKFVNNGSTTGAVNVPQVELPSQAMFGKESRYHRILNFHKNVPGFLNKMHDVISSLGVNVAGEYLRTYEDLGYVVVDVDPGASKQVVEGLNAIEETIRTRLLW